MGMKLLSFLTFSLANAAAFMKRDVTTTLVYPPTTFTRPFQPTTSVIVVGATVSRVIVDGTTATWVADHEGEETEIRVPGTTTTVEIPATTERFTLTLQNTGDVVLPFLSGVVNFGDASTLLYIPGHLTTVTVDQATTAELAAPGTTSVLEYPGTVVHLENPDGAHTTVVQIEPVTLGLAAEGVASTIALPGTTVTLSREGTSVVLTAASVTDVAGSILPGQASSSSVSFTAGPTETVAYPTCEVEKKPITPEEEVLLKAMFENSFNGYTYAQYVIWNAQSLLGQINYVLDMDYPVGDQDVVTNFSTLGYDSILQLASAAPMYSCFLSTLWADALANPQRYAKRQYHPTRDENIQLIVLFEERIDEQGRKFSYADILVEETSEMVNGLREIFDAAVNNTNAENFDSLFSNIDVQQFLSLRTAIPVYTNGVSDTLSSILNEFSLTAYPATTTSATTRGFTTVESYVTDYNGANITLPTTVIGSELVAVVCRNGVCSTETNRLSMAESTEVVIEDGKPVTKTYGSGQVSEESVTSSAAPSATSPPTRETSTPASETSSSVRETSSSVHETSSLTASIEVQKENGAFKHAITLGSSLLGLVALLI